MNILISIILIIIGFILLVKGAEFLVDGSSNIASRIHIPQIVIGLTIVSIGTSLPELFISATSGIKGHTDMQIGNIIGSNICNLLLILGVSATIKPLKLKRETRIIEIPMCFLITVIFAIFCNTNSVISKIEAITLLSLFIIFLIYTVIMSKKGEEFDKEEDNNEEEKEILKEIPIFKNIIYIILGIIGLKFGGDFIVDNAVAIAEQISISEKIVSLTILSIGSSLPELVTTIVAGIKGNTDISIGNIIGSNIFNITLITGVSSLINPVIYNMTYNMEITILILASFLLMLFPFIPPKHKMSRSNGILYLTIFLAYMIILFKI